MPNTSRPATRPGGGAGMTYDETVARMDAASLDVLREADAAHRRGENVGVYRDVLRQYGALLPMVRAA